MIWLWMGLALGADKSAQCVEGDKTVVFQDAAIQGRKGSRGIVVKEGLQGDLGDGLKGELRYEHAYGATFVILDIRKGDELLAEATTWLSVDFGPETNGKADAKPPELPLGAVSLTAVIGQRKLECHGNFL